MNPSPEEPYVFDDPAELPGIIEKAKAAILQKTLQFLIDSGVQIDADALEKVHAKLEPAYLQVERNAALAEQGYRRIHGIAHDA